VLTDPEQPPPDPCVDVARWSGASPVFTVGDPGDGILLVGFANNFGGEPTPGQVEFAVSLDGAPVPGSLELLDVNGVLG